MATGFDIRALPGIARCLSGAALCALVLAGCDPVVKSHGYAPRGEDIAAVVVGQDDAASVVRKLGRPMGQGAFEDDIWVYSYRQFEKQAFFEPEVVDQRVVLVDFDPQGVVEAVNSYGLEDGQVIDLVTRTTPTRGKRLSLLQQLFGNIGRFQAPNTGSTVRRPGT